MNDIRALAISLLQDSDCCGISKESWLILEGLLKSRGSLQGGKWVDSDILDVVEVKDNGRYFIR